MSGSYRRFRDNEDQRRRGFWWGVCASSVLIALIVTAVIVALVDNKDAPPSTRYAFVTTGLYAANFGGFTEANAICEAEAANSTLDVIANSTRHWRAILGTYDESGSKKRALVELTEDGITMFDRFAERDGPIYLPSGVAIAQNWTQFTSESITMDILDYPFIQDRDGLNVTTEFRVWTGGIVAGTGVGRNCGLWNETTGLGNYGIATEIDNQWRRPENGAINAACSTMLRLYCLMDTKR